MSVRAAAAIVLVGVAALATAGAQTAPGDVRFGTTISADSVTVGDPFVVRVRISVPRGTSVEFPPGPDTTAVVAPLDPRIVRANDSAVVGTVDSVASYRLAAWDVGLQSIDLGLATIRTAGGTRQLNLGTLRVFVRSVLPADSALRVPKPARPLFATPGPWWWPWLPILLAAALLGGILWWWWRRRRRAAGRATIDPFDLAEREFARVEALGLIEAGERGRFVALMVEVLRDFLAARVDGAHPSLTSSELIDALRRVGAVSTARLEPLLTEADLIKFARRPVSAERARELAHHARAIVRVIGRRPPPEPEARREAA